MIAKVDDTICIGCGACPSICPEIFRLNDEGIAEFYVTPIPSYVEATARKAEAGCPVDAIHIE